MGDVIKLTTAKPTPSGTHPHCVVAKGASVHTPNWETCAQMLIVLVVEGTPSNQTWAREELLRMAKILDSIESIGQDTGSKK